MMVLLLFSGLIWSATLTAGEPLYIEQYRAARPDAEALRKAEQQVSEHQNPLRREKMAWAPFHRQPEPLTRGEAFCQTCHAPLPHTQKPKDRSFLNMHSRFIACETCHFRPETPELSYQWLDYPTWTAVAGEASRFRTGSKTDNAERLAGHLKIAPFSARQPALARRDSDFARAIEKTWTEAGLSERGSLKARLHSPLKKEGPECGVCHQEQKPLLDLRQLGATATQVTAIQRHIIPQFFGRYRSDSERLRIIDILH
jgi:hypothetical protein